MGEYYLVLAIVALIAVAIGWTIGNKNAHQEKDKANEEMEFLEETNNLITTEDINLINAENNLNLLLDIEFGKLNSAKKLLIDNLRQYYINTKESISDELASHDEKELIERIENLAKADKNLQKVIR
jgi:hypothetical protein